MIWTSIDDSVSLIPDKDENNQDQEGDCQDQFSPVICLFYILSFLPVYSYTLFLSVFYLAKGQFQMICQVYLDNSYPPSRRVKSSLKNYIDIFFNWTNVINYFTNMYQFDNMMMTIDHSHL